MTAMRSTGTIAFMTTTNNLLAFAPSTIRAHRKKWLEALRSGDFLQAKGYLKKKTKGQIRHCCLGVASELCGLQSQIQDEPLGSGVWNYAFLSTSHEYGDNETFLPPEGRAWLGVNTSDPRVNFPSGPESVAALNDRGWSFSRIADAVAEHGFHPNDDLLKAEGRGER